MMAHLTLNCPHCRRQLVHVPRDSLTLYYRCPEHGAFILRPLKLIDSSDRSGVNRAFPDGTDAAMSDHS